MTRRLAATLALIAALIAAIVALAAPAHAQVACGGHGATHLVPARDRVSCTNTRVLLDGQPWTVTVTLDSDGNWSADFTRPTPAETAIPIEAAWHFGDSGSGGYEPRTGFLPAGNTTTNLAGHIDITQLVEFGCHTQADFKAFNSDHDTEQNLVRIAGPHFQFDSCAPTPSTSSPTSSPGTTVAPTTTPGTPSTTPGTVGTSTPEVPGDTLPDTGADSPLLGWAFALVIPGVILLALARRRPTDG